MFNPEEIIFSTTQACNLNCKHCFVTKNPLKLDIDAAKKLLESCADTSIYKIGFSGGEPFLNLQFLEEIIKKAVSLDYIFDQIMTNGVWWKTEEELDEVLKKIYEAGYDGKFGISYDSFHGQNFDKIKIFCSHINEIFGEETINIQTVIDESLTEEESSRLENELNILGEEFSADVFIMPQSYQSDSPKAWQSKKWFKEDYCEGPGQILFVHASGDIAPCCGFANENKALFIGKVTDSFDEIMKKANENKLVTLCYNQGLLSKAQELEKTGTSFPGKGRTDDICTFCDFMCRNS